MSDVTNKTTTNPSCSYKNAHIFSEFAKALQKMGSDLEDSVTLFDKVGEKNEMFRELESSMEENSIEPVVHMHNISTDHIYKFIYSNFVKSFTKIKDKLNFIHVGSISELNELVFFISTKDDETKELLYNTEFEYATGDLSDFLSVSFFFVEGDMEKDLNNTKKIELTHA